MTFETEKRPEVGPPSNTQITEDAVPESRAASVPTTPPVTPPNQKKALSPGLLVIPALVLAGTAYFAGRSSAPAGKPDTTPAVAAKAEAAAPASGDEAAPVGTSKITLEGEAAKTADIKTVQVRYAPFRETITVPGTVEVSPNRAARVTPPVTGRIISLFAAPGDRVTQGQRLVLIDSPEVAQAHAAVGEASARIAEAQAQVQTAQAGIEQAQTKRGSAQSALGRQRDLARTGAFSQPTLQAAQNEANIAQSELTQAQTDLQAQSVVVARNQRLFDAQVVAKAELEQSQVAQAQAQTRVEQTRKRLGFAQQTLEREQRVFRGGLLNRQAIQTAEAEVRAAEGEVRQARKQEQAARTSLEGTRSRLRAAQISLRAVEGSGHSEGGAGRIALYAPLGGMVALRGVSVGQAVERSGELFTIQNLDAVVVEASVPEASVARVRVGTPVTLTVPAYPSAQFTGVVQSIGSQIDEKTRALPVRCLVQNKNGALKPEMFARVNLASGGTRQALVVPDAAIDVDGNQRFVYVQTGASTYEKRGITVGRASGAMVEIVNGVKANENVATEGLFVLKSESKKDELKGDED